MGDINETEIIKTYRDQDANLESQEVQVENIINMIKEEFNLDNDDEGSEKSKDTGFEDLASNTQTYEEKNTNVDSENEYSKEKECVPQDEFLSEIDIENEKEFKDLLDFIQKAIDFNANGLDLSKKNLTKIPKKLTELNKLEYLYLEGNQLEKLPEKFFELFPHLKWLDLRNNQISKLPSKGLENHENLRYLLLENNKIKHLPCEISSLKNLNALNLTGNPIQYPPEEIVQKGCKAIIEFLKNDYFNSQIKNGKTPTLINDNDMSDIRTVTDDIWASDEETGFPSKQVVTRKILRHCDQRAKSATKFPLRTYPMRPVDAKYAKYDIRERINTAKISANRLRNVMKILNKRNIPNDKTIYKNEKYEKALEKGTISQYKKEQETIDSKIQKFNDKVVTNKFKDSLRKEQRKLLHKRLTKGVDYTEPVMNAPYDISEEHLKVMTNEEREELDNRLRMERMRSLSPGTMMRIEEERRIRDHILQDKIREYTVKLLNRRNDKNDNPKYDKLQAAKDLRELKAIQREIEQRRYEIQFNIRAYTGGLKFRETSKLHSRKTLSNVPRLRK